VRYGDTEIANEYAEIANEYAEIANEYAEIANEYAEIANEYADVIAKAAKRNEAIAGSWDCNSRRRCA
jgi:hypothetical protein